MASGRPQEPNDPSVMASVEAAIRTAARPGIIALAWHWRYELCLITGLAVVGLASGYALGAAWLIAIAATGLAILAAATAWPPARKRIIARAWCVITPHRIRTGCMHAWVQTRDGRLPTVLYTRLTPFGERVTMWCRAGITAADLEAARDILCAACWASDVRVVTNPCYRHIVVLEVIHRPRAEHPDDLAPVWLRLNRGEPDSADPDEPVSHAGPGTHQPFRCKQKEVKGTAGGYGSWDAVVDLAASLVS